jgi:hypothetical protein
MQIHLIMNGMRISKTEVERWQQVYAKQRKEKKLFLLDKSLEI